MYGEIIGFVDPIRELYKWRGQRKEGISAGLFLALFL